MCALENILDHWKNMFAFHILERGFSYYQEGRVWNIEQEGTVFSALVSGTEEYHVTVRLAGEGTGIDDLDCDCPYAADGSRCKHEAAVLYCLSESGAGQAGRKAAAPWEDRLKQVRNDQKELKAVISQIPENAVRDLLYELAVNNHILRNRIMTAYCKNLDERQVLKLKKTISDIQYSYSGRSGFIDWRNAEGYIRAMTSFLYDNVQPLINRGFMELAFELTCQVFTTIGNAAIDDDGDIATGAAACCAFWEQITAAATDEQQKEMYQWFEEHTGNAAVADYMEEYLDFFRLHGFHSKELLQVRLKELDALIRTEESKYREHTDRWRYPCWLEEHVLNRIQTMKELKQPHREVMQFFQKYCYLPEVLLAFAEEYQRAGKFSEAIELLKDGKQRAVRNETAVSGYSKRLIELYRETGDRQRLIGELLFQITECRQSNLENINLLKEVSAAETWPEIREQILHAETCDRIRADLYEQEGMLSELLQYIAESGSIYELEQYEKTLRGQFSEEIRNLYADYVRKEADRVSNRRQYRSLAGNLKKITRYPGGREIAKTIAAQWKKEHSRRPAFMDELRKAGF